ncbi:hypothetical protein ACE103_11150 [Bradyrhizobium sp. ma5]|uniref:hypothetical protein n=1 Tax=Bradyrhizobium sp. ma5 TaxID=3344828 RepID=UPI0035D4A7E1
MLPPSSKKQLETTFETSASRVMGRSPSTGTRSSRRGREWRESPASKPSVHAKGINDAILDAGRESGIRQLGGRAVFTNHCEACFLTILEDYLPAIFGDDTKEYLTEFKAAMPS